MTNKAVIILSHACNKNYKFSSRHIIRMQKGLQIMRKEKIKYIIVTGGKGRLFNQSDMPLGQLTKKWLVEKGVSNKQILIDDKSLNTFENAKFSLDIMKKHKINSAIIITSWPHVYRAIKVFTKLNSSHKFRLVCITSDHISGWWTLWDLIWEVAAWIKL